jgi:hypothetical protein
MITAHVAVSEFVEAKIRLRSVGNVARLGKARNVHKVLFGKTEGKKLVIISSRVIIIREFEVLD